MISFRIGLRMGIKHVAPESPEAFTSKMKSRLLILGPAERFDEKPVMPDD